MDIMEGHGGTRAKWKQSLPMPHTGGERLGGDLVQQRHVRVAACVGARRAAAKKVGATGLRQANVESKMAAAGGHDYSPHQRLQTATW